MRADARSVDPAAAFEELIAQYKQAFQQILLPDRCLLCWNPEHIGPCPAPHATLASLAEERRS